MATVAVDTSNASGRICSTALYKQLRLAFAHLTGASFSPFEGALQEALASRVSCAYDYEHLTCPAACRV